MRKFFLFGTLAAVLAAAVAFAAEIPEKITIKDCAATKPAVEFPHKAHFANVKDCTKCHHTSKGLTLETAAATAVEPCGKCHIKPEKAGTPICSDKTQTANPFHMMCVGCHKETKKVKADTKAPTMCTGCHPKAAS